MNIKSIIFVIAGVLIIFVFITLTSMLYAGGYYLTDRDGKVISENLEKTITVGPTEKTIVFNDHNDMKVFDIQWDADERTLIIKGDNVHLKVYSSGKIEKWSTFWSNELEQYPLFIKPVIPILPQR